MGLSDSRDPPGFQHTLAESWEVLLLASLLVNFEYVDKTGEHGDESPQCVPWKDNLQGFPALDAAEKKIASGLRRPEAKSICSPSRANGFFSGYY